MDVSRRALIVGGTSAIVGAGVGAGIAGLVRGDRPGPTLWQRTDRSGAPPVNGLHLRYGTDAASEVVVSWHTPQPQSTIPESWWEPPMMASAVPSPQRR